MALKFKIQPIERDVQVYFPEHLTDRAMSQTLARFAKEELGKAQRQNERVLGRVPPHTTLVDGREGAAVESVKPMGRIDFEFQLLEEVLDFVFEQLVKHSPRGEPSDERPGHPDMYMRSHLLFADNDLIEDGKPLPPANEYFFASSVPYARKIERGLSDQAEKGVYQVVAELANRRFSNMARVIYSFRALRIGDIAEWAATTDMPSPSRRGEKRSHWLRRQPAVVIVPR